MNSDGFRCFVISKECCKPGSVSPVLQTDLLLAPRAVVIYLWHPRCHPSLRSVPSGRFPYQIWVSRSQGLPRSISPVAREATFLWHFQRTRVSGREPFPRRQRSKCLAALVCTRYEHSRHLSLGEPGLSSTADHKGRGSDYPHSLPTRMNQQ